MTSKILYFHGFASSPASAKIALIRPMLEPEFELITPDLNVPSFEQLDWNAIIDYAKTFENCDLIAGSSMGALVALAIAKPNIPLLLIAPALGIADRWRTMLPDGDPIIVFNHAQNAKVPIHRKFFEQMFRVRVDQHAPPSRVTVIMGRNDESVPYDLVEQTWNNWKPELAAGSKFIEIAEGDHGLTAHAELIAGEIRSLLR
jgi:predicted esterase YcpF (UPF0227 family)